MALLKISELVRHDGINGRAARPYSKTCPPPPPPPSPEQEATSKLVADALAWQRKCQANPFAFGCIGISNAGGGGGTGNGGSGGGGYTCTVPSLCTPTISYTTNANGQQQAAVYIGSKFVNWL